MENISAIRLKGIMVTMTTKSTKPTKKDRDWQKKIEKNVKAEKVELDHPQGKEQFERTILRVNKLPYNRANNQK